MDKFSLIKNEYEKFSKELLRKGVPGYRETEKGIYGTMPCDDIIEIFKKINLSKYKNFLDAGSGDGRVVLIASLFTKATGIEIDKELHDEAVRIRNKLKLNAGLVNDDYFNHDFKKFDLIFVNPDKGFHLGLEDKLLKCQKSPSYSELKQGDCEGRFLSMLKNTPRTKVRGRFLTEAKTVVVYNNIFLPRFMKKKMVFVAGGFYVFVFEK